MIVLGIDPGYRESAWVSYDGKRVIAHGIESNESLLLRFECERDPVISPRWFPEERPTVAVFESVESYGMAVGREVFETVFWTGRLYQAAAGITTQTHRLPRKAVKLHLCQSVRAQDSNIRTALMDRFGGIGSVGTRRDPGPLFGMKSHLWSALAIAVTWFDLNVREAA